MSYGVGKRTVNLPRGATTVLGEATKADLMEAAYHLASIAHDAGCDDATATLRRLVEEINLHRAARGARPICKDLLAKLDASKGGAS